MNNYLDIVDSRWSFGSYYRRRFLRDTLYTCFLYKDIELVLDREHAAVRDRFAEEMNREHETGGEALERYYRQLRRFFDQMESYDQWTLEQIYGSVHSIRKQFLGAGAIEKAQIRRCLGSGTVGLGEGIDQSGVWQRLMEDSNGVVFCLADPNYFQYMVNDMGRAAELGKDLYVLTGQTAGDAILTREALAALPGMAPGGREPVFLEDRARYSLLDLSAVRYREVLQQDIDRGKAVLIVYGDDGLFHCRNLNLPSIVRTVPSCYFARAISGQYVGRGLCTIYVPPHFDILPLVPLIEKTRASYCQLARLERDFGPEIYELGLERLYARYPQYFINIYGEGGEERLPVRMDSGEEDSRSPYFYGSYCRRREELISGYLNGVPGLRYISAYMDGKTLSEIPVPWGCEEPQDGILVQGAVMAKARGSRVILAEGGARSPRALVAEGEDEGLLLISNFLFFLTPKLVSWYNELRQERPMEQIGLDGGHLDYMLRYEDGRRVETFPLYRKACVAMKRDGSFLFFQYALGGGSISLGGRRLSWTARDVNPQGSPGPICIFTPYRSAHRTEEKTDGYCEFAGEGRFNLVVIQDKVVCARMGDVMVPSIGAVVSLARETGKDLIRDLGFEAAGDGYYRWDGPEAVICLEPPEGIGAEDWDSVCWAFGGGMSLISDGESLFEQETGLSRLEDEGWLGPLSRQTQESEIHRLSKHPRTAVGVTDQGELFVLVFSGRTALSVGADYAQMGRIARTLVPNVRHMMNVDGGGSAVFGMAVGKVFVELSYPATSYTSPAGMVRQINTLLCMKQ